MSQHDLFLLGVAAAVILGIVVAIARLRLHPFPALMVGALALGLIVGATPGHILDSFRTGFGETLANVGTLLALGAMFGELLASSGGAERVSTALLRLGGPRLVPWTMCAVAMLLGLPLFFEAGVVLMMPIILNVGAQLQKDSGGLKGDPWLLAGLPVFAGIGTLHVLVPPHPGPMVAIDAIHADMGRTLGAAAAERIAAAPDEEIVDALAEQLDALGYEALAVKRDGEKQVEAYNCVFHALAKAHPDVCRFDLAFMEAATGRPVQHLECLVRGGQSCRFRLGPRKAN